MTDTKYVFLDKDVKEILKLAQSMEIELEDILNVPAMRKDIQDLSKRIEDLETIEQQQNEGIKTLVETINTLTLELQTLRADVYGV